MNENPYMMLAKFILPSEMTEYFDLTKVDQISLVENCVFIYTLTRRILSLRISRVSSPMASMKNHV